MPKSTSSELLQRFAPLKCTDPRDKIYAFLGLAFDNEEARRIPIDYTIGVPKLYQLVIRVHLKVLRILESFSWLSGVNRPEGFSSWARILITGLTLGPSVFE